MCLWTDFEYIQSAVKTTIMKNWVENFNFVWWWLKIMKSVKPDFTCSPHNNQVTLLTCLCDESPKLRVLLHNLEEMVIQNKQKNLIWVMYSTTQLFLFEALYLLNIDVCLFALYMIKKNQRKIIENFITASKSVMILIKFYMLSSVRLNLQSWCWNVILFDISSSQSIDLQAVDWVHWIENSSKSIYVMKYYIKNTFNDRLNELNVKKALFDIITELNLTLLHDEEETADDNIYDEDVDLEKWVLNDDKLINASLKHITDCDLSILDAQQILYHILSTMWEHTVTVWSLSTQIR